MNKAFEKILERLEKLHVRYVNQYGVVGENPMAFAVKECKDIVHEVAEEFATDTNVGTNGWIPCSERLPEDDSICIVTVEYPNNETVVDYGWFDRKSVCWFVGTQEFRTSNILAWQPLPKPYQPKGE